MCYLGTEQLSTNAQALTLKDQKTVDFAAANRQHSELIKQIRALEESRVVEPTDSIQLSCQLVGRIESSHEYIEDTQNMIARDGFGQVLRQKVKITLSYQAGANPISALFKNVQVTLDLPKTGVYCEQRDFKFDHLSFEGSSTPSVI